MTFRLHRPRIEAPSKSLRRHRASAYATFAYSAYVSKPTTLPEHVTHYHLLKQGIIMFEYLRNMGALRQARNQIVALPIRIPDSDGAPARVIAMEEAG